MPEALDVACPACGTHLKVDPETSAVVWSERPAAPARDLDDLVERVHTQRSRLDEKFERSVRQTRAQREVLDRKFEEARRRAARDPGGRPPNPFDNE